MNRLLPRDQFPPGLDRGNYVSLDIEEFRHAYYVFSASLDGLLPRDPDFPAEVQDAQTGLALPLEDTSSTVPGSHPESSSSTTPSASASMRAWQSSCPLRSTVDMRST
jgi:hypothetical protein